MEKPDFLTIPTLPGVYLYKDARGSIIYVGKARHLRKRVASYFRPQKQLTPKTAAMLRHASTVETLTTTTEKEALLLEASLIKKHRPRYNILLRDDKNYALFRIGRKHPYPRLEVVRQARRDGARYFGPFTSAQAARETWKVIQRAFPLRRCSDRAFTNRVRACLYHHMGQCLAPCVNDVPQEIYAALVEQVALLLSGKSDELLRSLRAAMEKASEALEFEQAARFRDQLRAVERTIERQAVVLPQGYDLDSIGVVETAGGLALGVLFVREGRLLDGRTFFWSGLTMAEAQELLLSFIMQFYSTSSVIPPRIVVPWLPLEHDEYELIADATPLAMSVEESPSRILVDEKSSSMDDKHLAATPYHQQQMHACFDIQSMPYKGKSACSVSAKECTSLNASSVHTVGSATVLEVAEQVAPLDVPEQVRNSEPFPRDLQVEEGALAYRATSWQGESAPSQGEPQGEGVSTYNATAKESIETALAELRGGIVRLATPRSLAEHRLVDMACANAADAAHREEETPLSQMLARVFHVSTPIQRIEAVDVSHTGGSNTRVGMVVFEDGRPVTSDYRNYAFPHGDGDDYAILAAWAARRAASSLPWPDLILIDGGRGQLAAVERAFSEQGVTPPSILASIAKARTEEGRADRRAGNIADRIFVVGRSNPLTLHAGSPELLFLQHVRDTVHDYAIGIHRHARGRSALEGELQRIEGIGPKTARLLWDAFPSLEAMRDAGEKGLANISGIGAHKAALVHQRLCLLLAAKKHNS